MSEADRLIREEAARVAGEKREGGVEIERRFLERLRLGASTRVSMDFLEGAHDVEFQSVVDQTGRSLWLAIRASLWADPETEIEVCSHPADWWQAVKARFAPAWFRRRFPVRSLVVTVYVRAVYPRLNLRVPPGTRTAEFIYGRSPGLAEPQFTHRLEYREDEEAVE